MENESNCCVLNINTGMGKTYIALVFAIIKQLKTLIVVHNDTMKKQWKKQIQQFKSQLFDIICVQSLKGDYEQIKK